MPPQIHGCAALVTGAAHGLGRVAAEWLASQGCGVTIVDFDERGEEVARAIQQANGKAIFVRVDVRSDEEQTRAFRAHWEAFGRLDIALLNAGIGGEGDFASPDTVPEHWHSVLDINLKAVATGTHLAIQDMRRTALPSPRLLACTASAGALFPMPQAPVYAATKAGVYQLMRSLGHLSRSMGIRTVAICPAYADTRLVARGLEVMGERARKRVEQTLQMAPIMPTTIIVDALQRLLADSSLSGVGLYIARDRQGRIQQAVVPQELSRIDARGFIAAPGPAVPSERAQGAVPGPSAEQRVAYAQWTAGQLGAGHRARRVMVHTLSEDFRRATRVEDAPVPLCAPGQVLVVRTFAGVNASDVNRSAGRYHRSVAEAGASLPFDAGFESVGVIGAVGDGVTSVKVGDPVANMTYGGFATHALVPERACLPVPAPAPEYLALLTSGLTASIALESVGEVKAGETVLVTAAAGGTGQFAVQLAKLKGCRVIATCSGGAKEQLLKDLGADRVVNFTTESLGDVLRKECPSGVDIVFESVGGDMFATAVDSLAVKGRCIVIGMMSAYGTGWPATISKGLPEKLLPKSASVRGFFLLQYTKEIRAHFAQLCALLHSGQLRVSVDPRSFVGADAVVDAVEHLQSGKSVGKVVVQMAQTLPTVGARLVAPMQPASKL